MTEHILFICNTYAQLITTIQIRKKIFPEAIASLILTDHSVQAEKIVTCLNKEKIFTKVKVAKTKYYIYQQNVVSDFFDIFRISLGVGEKYKAELFEDEWEYDRIFYYNIDCMVYTAMDGAMKQEKMPVLCRFEEGVHSYANMMIPEQEMTKRLITINKIRKLLHKRCILDSTNEFYVFFKELFPATDRNIHCIPKISRQDKELVQLMNKCFDYIPEDDPYTQKYIFFGSSRDVDGLQTEETAVVLQLADMVGKENLLVKMHPRDGRDVYSKYGITVSKKSSVPWEVIQMNHDFSNHVFITMGSGSVIVASALLRDQVETYFLYPLDKGKDESYDKYCEESLKGLITKLQAEGLCLRHKIVEQIGQMEGIFSET